MLRTRGGLRSAFAIDESVTPRRIDLRAAALALAGMRAVGAVGTAPCVADAAPIYTAVIDAGSNGTRISLYEVVPGRYPLIREIASHKGVAGDEGIDDVMNHVGGLAKTLGLDAMGEALIGPLLETVAPALKGRGVRDGDVVVDILATAAANSVLGAGCGAL